jgi:hypothetical protein
MMAEKEIMFSEKRTQCHGNIFLSKAGMGGSVQFPLAEEG